VSKDFNIFLTMLQLILYLVLLRNIFILLIM